MYEIISIGGATFDLFVKAHKTQVMHLKQKNKIASSLLLPYGGKVKIDEIHETLGGGAHNTSVAFSRLGIQSACCCLIGDDLWGKKVLANLEAERVSDELVSITEDEKTSFSVILNSFEGERTVLNYLGANHLFAEEYFPLKKIMDTKWIFLNHLSGEANRLTKKIELILKKKPEIKLAWNPGGVQLEKGSSSFRSLLSQTEVLYLNKEEAEKFSGIKVEQTQEIFVGQKSFEIFNMQLVFDQLHRYGVKKIVITDGRRGAQASDDQAVYFCPVLDTSRVDTLGAGDAFASGFTGALYLKNNLQTALIFGTINATSVVNHYGAQKGLLTLEKIQQKQKKFQNQIIKLN